MSHHIWMILGGHKAIKSLFSRMKHHKTRRAKYTRKQHRRSKTLRRNKRRGGVNNRSPCDVIRDELNGIRANLNAQTANTIDEVYGEVGALYRRAQEAGCNQVILNEIDAFKNGELNNRMDELLGENQNNNNNNNNEEPMNLN